MNRRKKFDRDEAIAILMEEMWELGYEACTVNSMSEKLGITRSSFYNAFGTKEKLFCEILDIYKISISGKEMFKTNNYRTVLSTITERMFKICRYQEKDMAYRGCLAANSIQEIVNKHNEIEPVLKKFFTENIHHFEKILGIAIKRGELEDCDVRIVALSLQNLIIGLSEMSKIFRKKGELWSVCQHNLRALGLYEEFESD